VADVGLSTGVKVADRLSLGATIAWRKVRLTYDNQNTIIGEATFHDQANAPEHSDSAVVFNAAVLYNPNAPVSAGLVFKGGGHFAVPYGVDFEGSINGPVACPRAGVCEAGDLQIPDTWGAGLGYRPSSNWLFAADAALVRYSQLSPTIFRAIPF